MRFYGLSKMLEAAELAARLGSKAEAVEHLHRLPFPASGPVKKDDPNVDIETYSFLTTTPNPLVATINNERMPVLLTREENSKRG
jgi:putative SOS response-associated peptidase YedK